MKNKILLAQPPFIGLQGEGHYVGTPSIFIRTFGCNLRCIFNDLEGENEKLDEIRFKSKNYSLDSLPTMKNSCDTFYAIYPEFVHLAKWYSIDDLMIEIQKLSNGILGNEVHIIFTGGEPLLPKWQNFYLDLIPKLCNNENIKARHFTFETNCTQYLSKNFKNFLNEYGQKVITFSFSMSPKISCINHTKEETINLNVIDQYFNCSDSSWLKFVVNDESDVKKVNQFVNEYKSLKYDYIPVYLMPQGGTKEVFLKNERKVYDLCLKYKFRYSPRLQCTVYDNEVGI